jgi:hypothetical protein
MGKDGYFDGKAYSSYGCNDKSNNLLKRKLKKIQY